MKLSFKSILPIILISALLILFAGCFGVPADEEPGYTPGTITGIIAAPCCTTSAEPVSETCCIAPEYWCYYCEKEWSLQDGVEVILTYGENKIATTKTNENGEFTFTDVSPGKNYVITALCLDFDDNRPLAKDVALELVEGGYFDTKITDLVSTSLGLVVDFLVDMTKLGPEDIVLDRVIAEKPDYKKFPKFRKLIDEVLRVLEDCQDVNADDDLQYALCRAAEEISGLSIGCGPGATPPPIPPPATYTLTMAVNPAGAGTTNPSVGAHSGYAKDFVENISATANSGYHFVNWTVSTGAAVVAPGSASTTVVVDVNKTVTANFAADTYTLTMAVNPAGAGTTNPSVGAHSGYAKDFVENISATANSGYQFVNWTGDVADANSASTTVTMDADKTVTANFRLTDIITFAELEGWNNAGCNPGFGKPHDPFSYSESKPDPEPYEIEPDIAWLTITNPNLKSVHFFINIATDPNPTVTYKYTTNTIQNEADPKIWSSSSTVGTITGPDSNGEYTFSSTCLVIPGNPSTSDYPHHFYINIDVNGINSYMVHLW